MQGGSKEVKVKDNDALRSANDNCSRAKSAVDFFFSMVMKRSKIKFPMGPATYVLQACIVNLLSLLQHAIQEVMQSIVEIPFKICGYVARECQNGFVVGKQEA